MKLTLHDYRRCPFCIRTRITLHLKGVSYSRIHEPLREWTPWMIKHVEHPRVPVLHIQNSDGTETIMPESNKINLWLDAHVGPKTLTPDDQEQYREMEEWWEWCAQEFKPMIDLYKYGENRVFDSEKHMTHTNELRDMLQKLEDSLGQKTNLLGKEMTLTDIAIIPFIRQIMRTRDGEFDFQDYPHVLQWAHQILGTEWFEDEVMSKDAYEKI